jgi:predicted class III extradiol MEMO1 family dioxygenase
MNRKELLIRQNDGRRKIDNYISKLVAIFDLIIQKSDFLDLETTDEIKKRFYEGFSSSAKMFSKTYNSNDEETLNNDVEIIALRLQGQEAYLITKESDICGAVKIPVIKALIKYKEIIELDGDSLNLITTDYLNYVNLDYYEEHGKFFYQLSVW